MDEQDGKERVKNPLAVALGKLAKGHTKTFTPAGLEARRRVTEAMNARRRARFAALKAERTRFTDKGQGGEVA